MPKKIIAGVIMAGALATGGSSLVVDAQINPYKTVQVMDNGKPVSALEIQASSTLPEAGTDATIVDTTQPKITLSKWNGEVAMGVTYEGIQATGARPFLSKNVDWSQGAQTMEAVPIDATTTMEDGGMEININLASKPASNIFTFQLDNWQNLDFFYQVPLWQEAGLKAPTALCTDTDCNIDGTGTSTRPNNVVDSYAVYYKNHANHIEGQINYGTGKAYQILRPLVTDANGTSTWASLAYLNGVLTVTVPQKFLDSAMYPLKVDPTFGYTTQGGTNAALFNGIIFSSDSSIATGAAGTGVSMSFFRSTGSGTGNSQGGIYASSTNTLVDHTVSVSVSTTPNWYTANLSGATLSAIPYILGVNGDVASFNLAYDTAGTVIMNVSQTFGTWPASPTWTYNNLGQRQYSLYVTYTASGGGATINSSYIVQFQ